jgi:sterol desaturase/sphingolipid hydroxylase (fatty acid hydroxylase superfamily)
MSSHDYFPTVVAASGLVLLLAIENWLPAAVDRPRGLRHAVRNLTLVLLSAVVMALLIAPLAAQIALWSEESQLGLLRLPNIHPVIATAATILLFDAWMYMWHRANHELVFLWCFHRVYHSDQEMDVMSFLRFHIGEILVSSALRLAVIPLLGLTTHQLIVYETLLLPVILFHHSNVRYPEKLDRCLRLIIVTPAIHRVHHSRLCIETDSNYSSIFSFWDRIAGTFRLRRDGQPVDFGLDEYDSEARHHLPGLMLMPFPTLRGDGGVYTEWGNQLWRLVPSIGGNYFKNPVGLAVE